MPEENERLLQEEVIRLQEVQRILELKERLKEEGEYRYLRIMLEQEANQLRTKIAEQLNSISLQLYDRNKVLNVNPKEEAIEEPIEEEIPEIEPPVAEENPEEVETPPVEEPREEVVEETKEQKKAKQEIKKLQKKIAKLKDK